MTKTRFSTKCYASNPEQLKNAREDIKELLKTTFCHPIMVIFSVLIDLVDFQLFSFLDVYNDFEL